MPMWAPPTPPKDDNDVYIDQTMYFLYEPTAMTETQLPPVYVRKEHKKPRIETVTTRKQKQRKEEQPRVPRSLFDRPTAALVKMRRDAKLQKLKQGLIKPYNRPTTPTVPSKPISLDSTPDHPEWLIHEDWALLQAVQTLLSLPLNLMVVAPAHIPNWDLVADVVNNCSRVYRSPKQCRSRYEAVIIPREEGRILYDISPRKQKKTKGIYKTKNNRPMRTSQLFIQDSNNSATMLYSMRFDSVKCIAGKRPPTMRQTLVNPTMKNPKHAAVLQDSGIIYDTPLTPLQVAANRADRIAREKKQNQAAAAAAAAEQQLAAQRTQQAQQQAATPQVQGTSTTTTPVVAASIQSHLQPIVSVTSTNVIQSGAVQKMAVGQGMTAVSIARTLGAGNIVVNTQPGITNQFAAINKRMNQANSTIAVTQNLTQAVRARAPAAVHEITTVTTQAGQVPAGTQAATATLRTATASTNLSHAQIASQRIAASLTGTAAAGKATTVQQQLVAQSQLKNFSPQQINILRQQQSIVRPQTPQQQAIRTQKLSITQKQGILNKPMKLTDEQVLAIRRQHSLKQSQAAGVTQAAGQSQLQLQVSQPQVRQIIQAQVQQVGSQQATSQTPVATLVKSVSAPAGTVPSVTIPVSINVSVGQHKAGVAQRATVSQLQQQQQQKMFLTQQRKTTQGQKVTALSQAQVAKAQQIPLIIPQQKGALPLTGQLLHQIVKQQQQGGQGATIQQIITHTSQPTIIATVTQGQPTQPMVAKVSLATSTPAAHIQTISGATPITVTQVSSAAGGQTHTPITLNVATPLSQTAGGATVVKATAVSAEHPTVQVQQAAVAAQHPKVATITQSLVSQQLQQVQASPQIHQIQATAVQASATTQPTTIQVQSPVVTAQASPSPVPTQVTITQAQAIPQAATIASVVTQAQQQQQQQQQAAGQTKPSPYAMRTRTRN